VDNIGFVFSFNQLDKAEAGRKHVGATRSTRNNFWARNVTAQLSRLRAHRVHKSFTCNSTGYPQRAENNYVEPISP
jgi:hypothetical protein